RGNDSEGRERVEGGRRGARARMRGAWRAVGAGDRAHREFAAGSADRDQHDPARPGRAAVQEDRRALRGEAAGTGDQEYSRGNLGFFALRIEDLWTRHSTQRSVTAEERTRRGAFAGPA